MYTGRLNITIKDAYSLAMLGQHRGNIGCDIRFARSAAK
jgi:hypothetical protein